MNDKLTSLVERFAGRRVLLVGDFMLDQYVFGDAERISPEAPVPVLRVIERQERVGGAGSVALDVVALGARVVCCGLLGQDSFGERVAQALSGAGADIRGLIRVGARPTITKTRLVGLAEHRPRQQIMVTWVRGSRRPLSRLLVLRIPLATARTLPCSGVARVTIRSASPSRMVRSTTPSSR